MVFKVEVIAPDGKPFAMTHRRAYDGKRYRIFAGLVPHLVYGDREGAYVLADEEGALSYVASWHFETPGAFEYIPGGQ